MLLHKAVQENKIAEVKKLLEEGADVNSKDKRGNTALHLVNDEEIASLLISSSSVDLNIQNDNGDTAVHIACIPTLERLRDVKTKTICCSLKILAMLLGAGASPNVQNQRGYGALHSVFVYGGISGIPMDIVNIRDIVTMLLKYSANVNLEDFEGCTPLHHVVREPNMASVAVLLLQAGANVNAKDRRGMTPLHHIFDLDDEEMGNLLLHHGGSINEKDVNGTTVLSSAVLVGNEFLVKLLLRDPRTDINLGDLNGITPLHLAAAYKYIAVCEILIAYGAAVNALDAWNATPLHYAAYGGTPEIVSLLLQASASHQIKDDLSCLPIQYALDRHYFYTALAFGEEYQHEVKAHLSKSVQINETELEDWILQSFPADDVLTMIVPASKVHSDPYNQDILPSDTMDYIKTKTNQDSCAFVRGMTEVPGIGKIPDIEEARAIRVAVESYVQNVSSTMAEIDPRFCGSLLCSGSVYEGTKITDPYEFDYMLCLEKFEQVCCIQLDENTQFDNVRVVKDKRFNIDDHFNDFFEESQLESDRVMALFVEVARKAISKLSFTTGSSNLYLQSLTEHTLVEGTWPLSGTVTCNLELIWNGLYYKQLVICVDLVPAIPISKWPCAARNEGSLLTDNIMSKGCHVVSKSGYWRLSFSLAEKMIMENLSNEQKLAFVGAKVMLHAAVSAKITIYDDSTLDDGTDIGNQDNTKDKQDDGLHDDKQHFTSDKASSTCLDEKSFHTRDEVATDTHDDGAASDTKVMSPILSGTMVGRVMTSSGSQVTLINISDKQTQLKVGDRVNITLKENQGTGGMSNYRSKGNIPRIKDILDITSALESHDSGTMIEEREELGNSTTRLREEDDILGMENTGVISKECCDASAINERTIETGSPVKAGESPDIYLGGHESDDPMNDNQSDSDIPAKTIEPRDVLTTYLLKMVFFHCLEENSIKSPDVMVTTEQIFQQIYDCLKEKRPLPYYFMQNHNLMDKLLESDHEDLCETKFTVMMLNTFLSQKP